MEVRPATKDALSKILELGKEFGHQMGYQKDSGLMEKYLPRILVAEETIDKGGPGWINDDNPVIKEVVGFYHYIVSGDPGFEEMLECYRQFPNCLVQEADQGDLCICMQGASHREVFREFILHLQVEYPKIWCYCSVKSQRVETYKVLGFIFNPMEQFTFFNCNKGDYSTYRLGRWKRLG